MHKYSCDCTSVCPPQPCGGLEKNHPRLRLASRLPDKSRVDLTDLGTFEDDFSTVRGAEFLLERVAFEVDGRQVRVRRRWQDWDRVEEVVVCLRERERGVVVRARKGWRRVEKASTRTQNSSSSVNGANSSTAASVILLLPTSNVDSFFCRGRGASGAHGSVDRDDRTVRAREEREEGRFVAARDSASLRSA